MKRVIITGIAGFIGSHLCRKLLSMGIQVIGIDDLSAGKMSNMEDFINMTNFSFVEADITNYSLMKDCFSEHVDIVFHQAASKKTVSLKDPMRDLEVNAKGTYNMLLLTTQFGVDKFVHASTGSVYGESNGRVQDENFDINPCSFYGISKFAGERYVNLFNKQKGLNTTTLRYFHVIGSNQDDGEFGGVMAIFRKKLLAGESITIFGDGKQERYFTHVSNVVEANIIAALDERASGQVYNVCCDKSISLIDAVRELGISLGVKPKIEYAEPTIGDIKYFNVSNAKIKKDLGIYFISFKKALQKIKENTKPKEV